MGHRHLSVSKTMKWAHEGGSNFVDFVLKVKRDTSPILNRSLKHLQQTNIFSLSVHPQTWEPILISLLCALHSPSEAPWHFPPFLYSHALLLHWCREKFLLPVHIFSTQYDFLAVKYACLFQQMSSLHPYLKTTAGALLTQCIVSARHTKHFASLCKIVFRMCWKRRSDFLLQGFFSLAQYWGPRAMLVISRERSWWW